MNKVFALFMFFFAVGCNYNNPKDDGLGDGAGFGEEKLESPDFMTVQMALIGPKCLRCHSNAGGNKGESNLESYKNVRAQLNKLAYRVLELRDMPPQEGLSERQIRLLRNWVDQGAPETQLPGSEKPDSTLEQGPINWAKIRDKIFVKKYAACHFPPSSPDKPPPMTGLDLSSLAEVRNKAALIFERVVIKQDMPIEPYPAISPRERRVLLKWFEMGMQD